MNKTIINIIIIISISLLITAGFIFIKRLIYSKLVRSITYNQSEYEKLKNKISTKLFISRFTILFLDLNLAIIQNNVGRVNTLMKEIKHFNPSDNKAKIIYSMLFNYYLNTKHYKEAKECYEIIKNFKDEQLVKETDRMYNIFILKNDKYLNEMLSELEDIEEKNRFPHEYLISMMYKNINNHEMAKKYEDLAKKHLEMSK